jgi:hypothetical protein
VIQVVNNGEVKPDGFATAGPAVNLKPPARRAFITADERRLDQPTLVGALHYQYVQT